MSEAAQDGKSKETNKVRVKDQDQAYLKGLVERGWENVYEDLTESEREEDEDGAESEAEASHKEGIAEYPTPNPNYPHNLWALHGSHGTPEPPLPPVLAQLEFTVRKDGYDSGIELTTGTLSDLNRALATLKNGGFDITGLRIITEGLPDAPLLKDPIAHISMPDLCREFGQAKADRVRMNPNIRQRAE